jgi:diaminopropionate ammonia-lyase
VFIHNSHPAKPPRPHLLEALGKAGRAKAEKMLQICPAHKPTPLHHLKALAQAHGLTDIAIKDEGQRLGLKSFKALGGAYAVMQLVLAKASAEPQDLQSPHVRAIAQTMTVACATDGNHGRSVAAGARLAGCACVIFVHEGVSDARIAAIAAFGARIMRVKGSYDDSVAEATRQAHAHGWTIVSDTSWPGYEDIPLTVMQGYTIMAGEAFDALSEPPTHIFLQAGVGGMAAAVAAHASACYGEAAPKIIIVEPERAACIFTSAKAGRLTAVPHGEATIMGMLECYEPSAIAWDILSSSAAGFVTLPEEAAINAMCILATPQGGDTAIVSGESGCTGLAGLLACLNDEEARNALALNSSSRILLFNSEGATDPELYKHYVDKKPEDV